MTSVDPTSSAAASSASSANSMKQLSGNFSTFLQLLTSQLKNQDPSSPMDTNQFTQQLVEYSQVEQQIDTNTNLKSLLSANATQNGAFATSYLGKRVTVSGGQGALTNGQAEWTYNLGAAASAAVLTVTNSNGATVFSGSGPVAKGDNTVSWDGKDNHGNQMPDGTYTLNVAATDANGTAVTSSVSSSGLVSEINMASGSPQLVVGGMQIGLSGISSVTN